MNKKIFFPLILTAFFIGCSQKEISISAIEKPREIQNQKIRFIKIEKIKNDKTNLKEKIIQKMKEVNQLIPNYFHINPKNYKSILNGNEKIKQKDNFYTKRVKIIYKKPRCIVTLYPCKEIGDKFFCKYSNPIHYSLKEFENIKKNIYQNKDYILINEQIYKKELYCKPEYTELKCEKKEISLEVKLNIKDKNNNLLFSKIYKKFYTSDPCADIKEIYPTDPRKYNTYLNFNQKADELAYFIASNFIEDIAPHIVTFNAKLFDELDVKIDYKDKKIFENILDKITKNQITKNLINEMQQLLDKYPKSCVLKYDLGVMYMKIKNYLKVKNLLLQLNNCNKDIQKERERLINLLKRIYF